MRGLLSRLLRERDWRLSVRSLRRWLLRRQRGERHMHGLPSGLLRLEYGRVKLRSVRQRLLLGERRGVVHQVQQWRVLEQQRVHLPLVSGGPHLIDGRIHMHGLFSRVLR